MNTGMVGWMKCKWLGREDGDEVNTNEQIKNYQATPSKSPHVRVKTKAARKLTPSKKKTSTTSVPHYKQPSEHPTTSRGGTNDYIIIVLCIIFDYFKLKIVSELMFSRTPSKGRTSTPSVHESEHLTTNRGGTPKYMIIFLYDFDYFKLTMVSELMFKSFLF
jgi:hypothetical protein